MQQKNKKINKKLEIKENNKFIIKNARKIAVGFDDIDLRKPILQKDLRRAKKYIREYNNNIKGEKSIIIRPTAKNKKIYAEYAGMSTKFKKFPLPAITQDDKYKIVKIAGEKRIKRISEFSDTIFYKFKSQNNLVKNTKNETDKLIKVIDKEHGKIGEKYAIRIKCGQFEYKPIYYFNDAHNTINDWLDMYGIEKVKSFCIGFQAYIFKNQDITGIDKIPLKKKKRKKKKINYKLKK